MDKRVRCEARNEHGHRCRRRAGHDQATLPRKRERARIIPDVAQRPHRAFGREWGS